MVADEDEDGGELQGGNESLSSEHRCTGGVHLCLVKEVASRATGAEQIH